jgi:hypothetical protein
MGRSGAREVKISFAGQSLTHFGGLFLLHRFVQRLGLRSLLADRVRFEQRNNRYAISESLLAWLYPMVLGLGRIETTRVLQYNGVFQYLTGLPTYPDPQTLRRFLVRFAEAGLESFLRLQEHLHEQLRPRRTTLTLDLDTSVLTVYGRQERAAVGYNPKKRGRRSYLAWLCADADTGEVWHASYHPGNTHAATISAAQLPRVFANIPPAVRDVRVRADAAFYNGAIIEFLEGRGARYAIVAQLTQRLKAKVAGLRYTRVSPGVWAADFRYHPTGWSAPRRFIAIRRRVKEEPSYQLTLWRMGNYAYQVIVTNLPLRPLNLWRFYNGRAGAELVIREMKEGYALGNIPSGVWSANVAYFHLVVFAYNLLHWFQRLCVPPQWSRLTLPTLRQRLLLIPAELVRPHGRAILRMPHSYPHQEIFQESLRRIARFNVR